MEQYIVGDKLGLLWGGDYIVGDRLGLLLGWGALLYTVASATGPKI